MQNRPRRSSPGLVLSIMAAVALGFAVSAAADEKPAHQYVGVKKCAMCHKAASRGNQYGQWLETRHAKAYETLASEKALAVAKERGLETPPQENAQCLKCHVTGYGEPPEAFATSFKKEDGIGCESCHGPGSHYKSMKIMKDRETAVAAGLIIPDKETCLRCHNEESPFYKEFKYDEFYAKIAHPDPNLKKAKSE